MGCDVKFVKYVLFLFDVLIGILGISLLVIGVGYLVEWSVSYNIQFVYQVGTPWGFIIIGSVMLVAAFFGCYASIHENHRLIFMYLICLVVILTLQVVMIILLFAFDRNTKIGEAEIIDELFQERSSGDEKSINFLIDNIQEQFNCCGAQGPQDYNITILPESCCLRDSSALAHSGPCTINNANPGCIPSVNKLSEHWSKNPIAGILIGIACVEIVGATLAAYYANSLKHINRRSRY